MLALDDPLTIITVALGGAAIFLALFSLQRERTDRTVYKATLELLQTVRDELHSAQSSAAQSEKLHAQEETQWKRLKDLAKGVGWVWERLDED